MDYTHEPAPGFAQHLEWQVVTAMRRRNRFARPVPGDLRRYAVMVPLVLASMLLGAAGVTASDQIQENRQKELLVTRLRMEVQVARMRFELADRIYREAQERAAKGIAGSQAVSEPWQERRSAELEMRRATLNLEEVETSGLPVQDDVTAPLVKGRDFVTERLNMDLEQVQSKLGGLQSGLQEIRQRYEAGLVTEIALMEAQTGFMQTQGEIDMLSEKVALRRQFLAGEIDAELSTLRRLQIVAHNRLVGAQSELAVLYRRYEVVQQAMKAGTATEVDVLRARLQLLEQKNEIELLQSRLQMLEQGQIPPMEEPDGGGDRH